MNGSKSICPRCGFRRNATHGGPDYECPDCGIVYDKFVLHCASCHEKSTGAQIEVPGVCPVCKNTYRFWGLKSRAGSASPAEFPGDGQTPQASRIKVSVEVIKESASHPPDSRPAGAGRRRGGFMSLVIAVLALGAAGYGIHHMYFRNGFAGQIFVVNQAGNAEPIGGALITAVRESDFDDYMHRRAQRESEGERQFAAELARAIAEGGPVRLATAQSQSRINAETRVTTPLAYIADARLSKAGTARADAAGKFSFDLPAGRYVLAAGATKPRSDVTYHWTIRVDVRTNRDAITLNADNAFGTNCGACIAILPEPKERAGRIRQINDILAEGDAQRSLLTQHVAQLSAEETRIRHARREEIRSEIRQLKARIPSFEDVFQPAADCDGRGNLRAAVECGNQRQKAETQYREKYAPIKRRIQDLEADLAKI